MMTIQEVTAALAGGKLALEGLRHISKAGDALDKAELKLQIADVVERVLDLIAANQTMTSEVERLEKALKLKQDMVFYANMYFYGNMVDDKFQPSDGPWCAKCFDSDQKQIRMHFYLSRTDQQYSFMCPSCKIELLFPVGGTLKMPKHVTDMGGLY